MDKKSPPGQLSADPAGVKRGGYLLSHFRSTIGVAGFNFSVRNGKRWSPRAIATLISLQCQGWWWALLCAVVGAAAVPVPSPLLCKVKKEAGN